jgi:hypothetical protein
VINILAADKLLGAPKIYAVFLLWLMAELFEELPEAGDLEKPKLVFFFDEAHLLFDEAPKALLDKIEQVVRLIRSKGVGVYFVTQNPLDVPDAVLGQLGNRVQHALRAFTPRDQKAVRTAAETMRPNPSLDLVTAITELGVGEALVSFLDEKGTPGVTERAFVLPPSSRIGPLLPEERQEVIAASGLQAHYGKAVDRESAFEVLRAAAERERPAPGAPPKASGSRSTAPSSPFPQQTQRESSSGGFWGSLFGGGRRSDSVAQTAAKSVVRTVSNEVGRQIVRGLLGSILGGRRRR